MPHSERLTERARVLMVDLGIGGTPVVELAGFDADGRVWLKAEYANRFGSVKDRTAAYLVAWAIENAGAQVRIVESTSGNLGVSLPRVCEGAGLPSPLLVVDASVPSAKLVAIEESRGEVVLVSTSRAGMDLRQTRIALARELGERDGFIWVNQYGNDAGVLAHADSTGPELTRDVSDAATVIAPISTGGTACGIAMHLVDCQPTASVVAVEPSGSTIFGGEAGSFITAGAGMNGPSEIVQRHGSLLRGYAKIPDEQAAEECLLAKERYDLELGLTAGAALACARAVAGSSNGSCVVIAPDGADHYLAEFERLLDGSRLGEQPPAEITVVRL